MLHLGPRSRHVHILFTIYSSSLVAQLQGDTEVCQVLFGRGYGLLVPQLHGDLQVLPSVVQGLSVVPSTGERIAQAPVGPRLTDPTGEGEEIDGGLTVCRVESQELTAEAMAASYPGFSHSMKYRKPGYEARAMATLWKHHN